MMDITLSILALISGGVILELFAGVPGTTRHQAELSFSAGADAHELAIDLPPGNPS